MKSRHAAELARSRTIAPRNLELEIPEEMPRYWLGGDAYATHLMHAFSLMFPAGERFFMDAVRAYRNELSDPQLLAQVRGFLAQEALHSREHRTMNSWLSRFGIDPEAYEAVVADDIEQRRARRTPMDDLAVTCALEHFTAIMADLWLNEPALRTQAAEPLRTLWTWHALEELDHKSVAFDVYRAVGGEHARRVRWMLRITVSFILGVGLFQYDLLRRDGKLREPLSLARGFWKYWGPRGYFTRLIPSYLRYYKRDFHPWDDDHSALITRFERELEASQYARSA
jgi:uncharacterized protein